MRNMPKFCLDKKTFIRGSSMILTQHATTRIVQRVRPRKLGKTPAEIAHDAYHYGVGFSESTGWSRKYLNRIYRRKGTANNTRLYLGYTWIICDKTLVTVWDGPGLRKSNRWYRRKERYQGRRECRRWA